MIRSTPPIYDRPNPSTGTPNHSTHPHPGLPGPYPQHVSTPPQFYMPPYFPPPNMIYDPPMEIVDNLLPQVPFNQRPNAYKVAIILICIGVGLCLIFSILLSINLYITLFTLIFIPLFIIIGILGICSVILLSIPKKIGWHVAVITGVLGLSGLGLGTLIAIFTLVALLWPSVRYYFHTGYYPPYPYFMPPFYTL